MYTLGLVLTESLYMSRHHKPRILLARQRPLGRLQGRQAIFRTIQYTACNIQHEVGTAADKPQRYYTWAQSCRLILHNWDENKADWQAMRMALATDMHRCPYMGSEPRERSATEDSGCPVCCDQ